MDKWEMSRQSNKAVTVGSFKTNATGISEGFNGTAMLSAVEISQTEHKDGNTYIKLQPYTSKGKAQIGAKLEMNIEAFDILVRWYLYDDEVNDTESPKANWRKNL